MKKVLGMIISITMFLSSICFYMPSANADTAHDFSLVGYNCNELDEDYLCVDDDNQEIEEPDEISSNGTIGAGKIIKIGVYYVPGTQTDIGMQVGVKYDPSLVEPIYLDGELYADVDLTTDYFGGIWPKKGTTSSLRTQTNWYVQSNDYTADNELRFLIKDSQVKDPIVNSGFLVYVYFRVKDTAQNGANVNFTIDSNYTKMSNKSAVTTSNYSVTVSSDNTGEDSSSNRTLNSLEVSSGGTTYPLSPEFIPDDANTLEYSTIVPYSITSVDLTATATASSDEVSGTGSQPLNVGNNSFDITVTDNDGEIQTYQVNVYRLNNNTELDSLSLSNANLNPDFSSSTKSYTASVEYSIESTIVYATVNSDNNSSIDSGTGNWNLTNYGTTPNTRSVVVKAEDCKPEYASVPNNSCTSDSYNISVTRAAPSTIKTLTYLSVDGVEVPGFSSTIYEYTLDDVANSKDKVNVVAIAGTKAKIKDGSDIGDVSLSVGDNTLIITVVAEDGSEQDYKIKIRRLSNDWRLGSLTVTSDPMGELSPTFSKDGTSYTYTAPATAQTATIAATANYASAQVESGPGTYNIDQTPEVEIKVKAEDGTPGTYKVKLVRAKSDNALLKSLSVDGYTLTPQFSPQQKQYDITVASNVTSVNVSAEPQDPNAQVISGTGSQSLSGNVTTISVVVQAEDGSTTETYTITVTKVAISLALIDLKVDGNTVPDFSENTFDYTIVDEIPFSQESVEITATPKGSASEVTVTGTGTIPLTPGQVNDIHVIVTENCAGGSNCPSVTYTVHIKRAADDNNLLKDIKIDNQTIDGFEKKTFDYYIEVENNVTSLNLSAIPDSEYAYPPVISGNENFVTSKVNEVTITVTSQKGTTQIYKIYVTRKKSNNNYLESISLSSGTLDPTFEKTHNSYVVEVERNITTITITGTPEDPAASAVTNGPASLDLGDNTFTITVTSESGSDNVYTITVKRKKSDNSYLKDLRVDGTTVTGFVKTTKDYTISVTKTTQSIEVAADTEEEHAIIESGIGTIPLTNDETTISIVVKAEDGTSTTYTITVKKDAETISTLKNLYIEETAIKPSFNPSITSYTAEVDYSITNITIVAEATDPNAQVEGTGPKDLQTGVNGPFEVRVVGGNITYTITVTRKKNNNAYLSNLEISGGYALNPTFTPEETDYEVNVPNSVNSINLTATPQDQNATYEVRKNGSLISDLSSIDLDSGNNVITIIVTAEDGVTIKNYNVTIKKELSSDALLKDLTVSSGILSPDFTPNVKDYEVTVPYEVENLDVFPIPNSDKAQVISITGNKGLKVGSDNEVIITVQAEDNTIEIYKIKVTRQPSSNNKLLSLSVKDDYNKEYIEVFNPSTTRYNITVESNIDKVTISAQKEDTGATVAGDTGVQSLVSGLNSFTVTVTSADDITRTYEINITRKSSSNNYLDSLEVENYSIEPTFVKTTILYKLTVPNTENSVKIIAIPEIQTSIATLVGVGTSPTGNNTFQVNLQTGVNTFQIDVMAQDSSVRSYVILITKEADDNNYLASLSVNGQLVDDFRRDKYNYEVEVDYNMATSTIEAIAEHPLTSVVTGAEGIKNLEVGDNIFEIKVKAENNETRIYKVNIKRKASSNNLLSDLTIDGSTVDGFDKNKFTYNVTVPNETTSVDIDAIAEDIDNAIVSGLGKVELETGENTITISVQAQDGTIQTYEIIITREKNGNNYLASLQVAEGMISPDFARELDTYTLEVPNEVENLTIDALPEELTSKIEIQGDTNLDVGQNTVTIKVIAENGEPRTYTINVTRLPDAANYLMNISVRDTSGINYPLSPEFDKKTLTYEVELSASIDKVEVVVQKDDSVTVEGDGLVNITSLPQIHQVKAMSASGIARTYTIVFRKGLSRNANLLSLSVDKGSLNPIFNPTTTEYTVDLVEPASEITVTAVKAEDTQEIIGATTHKLSSGRNEILVYVISEGGVLNIYTIIVNVPSDGSDNVLTSLSVDKGELTPAFSPTTYTYVVNLDPEEQEITITAEGKYTITGDIGTQPLVSGTNEFEVISTDNDGHETIYKIVVNNGVVSSTKLANLEIKGHELNEKFDSDTLKYTSKIVSDVSTLDIIATPIDTEANVTITGNASLVEGKNTIVILVTKDGLEPTTYEIEVEIISNKIKSNIHIIDDTYVRTIVESQTSSDVKSQMTNPVEYLKIYDLDGDEVADDDIVGTGFTIKLVIDNKEYDSKILIIKGDLNSDGEVGVADVVNIRLYTLESAQLSPAAKIAADTNEDGDIGVADLLQIRMHILGSYNLYAREVE